ncbi:MAG: hypothetical protein BAA01_09375 [Bacillus thermozeamaize]|uniref:Recombinase RecT n=1 Tax=Bacillus thermozeamaize TaxID=230954 RepID=A0A1Y3PEC5_9BACI|nr:MAG: hypothetical protein BAA01_09375 [Bacillus thermozeamaize]
MSKALASVNTEAVVGGFTQAELDTLKATIARGTTNEQFALFVQTCVNAGLNPFLNHVHCIVYQGKDGPTMSIQVAVEGILYLARQCEGYKGIDVQLVHENDDFKVGRDEQGNIKIKQHEFGFPRGKVIGGYAIARREGFPDVVVVMEVDEVEHMLKGRNAHKWREWFNDMFKKHIVKRAAKLQFGIEIAEDEHVPSGVDVVPEYKLRPDAIDVTPQEPMKAPESVQQEDKPDEEAATKEKLTAEIKDKFKRLGITTAAGRKEFFEQNGISFKDPKDPTIAEMTGLIKVLDMHLAQQADDDLLE